MLNGLKDHVEDKNKALQIPLGIIPAGTGNGIAASLQIKSTQDALDIILKGIDISISFVKFSDRKSGKTRPTDTFTLKASSTSLLCCLR